MESEIREKIYLMMRVNNINIRFELDTGAPVTLISKNDKEKFFPNSSINKTNVTF